MLQKGIEYDRDKRLDKEAIKMRILSILKERNLTNAEVRHMTGMDRQQVLRLMRELEADGVQIKGSGRGHIIVYLEMSKTKGKQMIHYYVAIINN